jgi:hypothetical protein
MAVKKAATKRVAKKAAVKATAPASPGYSSVAHIWDKTVYAKGDVLPAMSVSQFRHAQERGYAQVNATLVVGKPFKHLLVNYVTGDPCPDGLTDAVTRRLVAGRFLT